MREMDIEEVRNVQLDILEVVNSWCEREDVPYYLAFGSLLGAVRHGGYIPWDDDIDLWMFRQDYERFIRRFPTSDEGAAFDVGLPGNAKWPLPFVKVADKHSLLEEDASFAIEQGVNIDIFPIDEYPRSPLLGLLHGAVLRGLRALWLVKSIERSRTGRRLFRRALLAAAQVLTMPVSMPLSARLLDRFVALRGWRSGEGPVGVMVATSLHRLSREWFAPAQSLPFEQGRFPTPGDSDQVLRELYGEYWEVPPVEKRTPHSFTAYWRG